MRIIEQRFLESNEWTTSPTYYCNVTALKIISKDDFTLGYNQILHATLDMRAPAYSGTDLYGKIAYNTFKTKHDCKEIFEESNMVKNSILHNASKVSIPVTKVWSGQALDSVTVYLVADTPQIGDVSNIGLWLILAVCSMFGLLGVMILDIKKRSSKHSR